MIFGLEFILGLASRSSSFVGAALVIDGAGSSSMSLGSDAGFGGGSRFTSIIPGFKGWSLSTLVLGVSMIVL